MSKTTPGPYKTRTMAPLGTTITPTLGFAETVNRAGEEAKARGFDTPLGGIYYEARCGFYNVSFSTPAPTMAQAAWACRTSTWTRTTAAC